MNDGVLVPVFKYGRRVNFAWIDDEDAERVLAHGFEHHPRRNALCSPFVKAVPPHEREVKFGLVPA